MGVVFRNYSLNVIHATVANLNCVSVKITVQFVASGEVCVHKVETIYIQSLSKRLSM